MVSRTTNSVNISRILRTIWQQDVISRRDIARLLGLDKSTVSNIVGTLLKLGIVLEGEEGEAAPTGGRRPVALSLNRQFGSVLGVEIQPEYISALEIDFTGEVIRTVSRKVTVSGENIIEAFVEFAESLLREIRGGGREVFGIGVGVSGIVNPENGSILKSIPLGISEPLPFAHPVTQRLGLPVFIENDANACSWGELVLHRNEDLKNFLTILIEFREVEPGLKRYGGVAVGMGVVIGGRVYYGEDFSAGEFRSVFAGKNASDQFSLANTELAAARRDPELFSRFIEELSVNVSLLVNTFNFKRVFLVGAVEGHSEEFLSRMCGEIQKNWSYPGSVDCTIDVSSIGETAVAYGAAGVILERFFRHPEVPEGAGPVPLYGLDLITRHGVSSKKS